MIRIDAAIYAHLRTKNGLRSQRRPARYLWARYPMSGKPSSPVIRFGPYELDLRSAELRKNDLKIRLQDQPFQILVALLERPGDVVLREEIRKRLWPNDTVVEFDHSINAAVKRLRDALRDSADQPRYVETVARRGYRFIGEIEKMAPAPEQAPNGLGDSDEWTEEPASAPQSEESRTGPADRLPPGWRALVLVSTVLIASLGAWYFYQRTAHARWARATALPEASRLVKAGKYPAAFEFLLRARQAIPNDPVLDLILREISHPVSIHSTPAEATVYIKAYDNPNSVRGKYPRQKISPKGTLELPFKEPAS